MVDQSQPDIRNRKDIRQLMRVALGQEPADLVVINARLVNVYTAEILEHQAVCVKDKWIASVGPEWESRLGPQTIVIDAAGRTLVPGFIDGHTHLASLFSIDQFLSYAMPGGTTTVVTETMEAFPVAGEAGVLDFLDAMRDQPAKIFATAPFMGSISRKAGGIAPDVLHKILTHPNVIGLGESYWQAVLQKPEQATVSMQAALRYGKTLEGHSAGARGSKLMAYVVTGVSSCHEPILPDEVLERLRFGLYVMIREGSIRRDLEAISKIKDAGIDNRRLILVSDGVAPKDLIEKGYMEYIVQKAIDCGFDPLAAIQMATLNVAEHFALDDIIGGIAPGRCADLVIIPDVRTIRAETVISNGQVIAENGRLKVSPRRHAYRAASLNTVNLPRAFRAGDFAIRPPAARRRVTARVIEMVTDLVTRELQLDLTAANGGIGTDPANDLIKVAAVDRHFEPGKTFTGLIKGFGLKSGAIACSAAWDTSDLIVVGAADADMALAVNRIHEMQGGAVVCDRGEIRAELSLPVFGIMSMDSMTDVARRLEEIGKETARLGCPFADPLLSLITLTGAAIPYLRICEEGLVNLKDGNTKGLFVEREASDGSKG